MAEPVRDSQGRLAIPSSSPLYDPMAPVTEPAAEADRRRAIGAYNASRHRELDEAHAGAHTFGPDCTKDCQHARSPEPVAASDVTEDVSLSSRSDEAELHHKALVERLAEAITEALPSTVGWQCRSCRWATADGQVMQESVWRVGTSAADLVCPECFAEADFTDWYDATPVLSAVLPIIGDLLAEKEAERDALRALFTDANLYERVDGHLFYKIRKDDIDALLASEEKADG